ncbi:thiol:disulfide interchange protein [Rubrivivax gelatinosus]|nr:thiol:disulfide interchange protein [Rubrivivax gelatinosus]
MTVTRRRAVLGIVGVAALAVSSGELMRRFGPAGPSPLVDEPAPPLAGPRLDDPALAWSSLSLAGQPWLLNFWASWCAPCRDEHPLLVALAAERRLTMVGVAHQDRREAARGWLARQGNPYDTVLEDADGALAAPWRLPGVPATFVVDAAGRVRLRRIGALRAADLDTWVRPLLKELGA